MRDDTDAELTLPSVVAALPEAQREEALVLTIAFHPDTSRIGQAAVMPLRAGEQGVGRLGPSFARCSDGGGRPLEDRQVSRRSLRLTWADPLLRVSRHPGSCRCRLDGRELLDEVALHRERLAAGVPLVFGHGVVLCLRLAPARSTPTVPGPADGLLLGSSAHMAALREQVALVAETDLDVLIRGETGTGKELVATAIHRGSRRRSAPLVCVNVAAIPPGLAAAALFGSTRGAYTGAQRPGEGYFQQAQGGCLFLDEIGDAPAEIQPQLLRALQQREIQSVGGRVQRVDLRVISATDADLEGCGFKAALRHRLGASEIVLEPLRAHPEDIGELLWHFLVDAAAELGREQSLPGPHSDAVAVAGWADLFHRFLCYSWPGNVRELANFARQVLLASDARPVIPAAVAQALQRSRSEPPPPQTRETPRPLREVTESELDRALEENCFEVAPAARQLRVSRTSMYRRIERSPRHRLASQVPLDEARQALARTGGDVHAAALQLRVSPSGLRARLRDAGLESR
jgi:two-component system nitrogen regulation response regulator GlnG